MIELCRLLSIFDKELYLFQIVQFTKYVVRKISRYGGNFRGNVAISFKGQRWVLLIILSKFKICAFY